MGFKQSLIDNNSVSLNVKVSHWHEAIKVGTDMLVTSGAVDSRYCTAIIRSVEKLGPYICIAPDFALPHARPEDGVNRTAFALVTLATPVEIDGEMVKVMITLASENSDEHIQGLMEITQVLDDEKSETGINLNRFLACKSKEDIYQVIDNILVQ